MPGFRTVSCLPQLSRGSPGASPNAHGGGQQSGCSYSFFWCGRRCVDGDPDRGKSVTGESTVVTAGRKALVLIGVAAVLVCLVAGGVMIVDGVRDLGAPASCAGIVMGPGDTCTVAKVRRYRNTDVYESWSRAGTSPVPPVLPPRVRPSSVEVLDPDGIRHSRSSDGWTAIGFGAFAALPCVLFMGLLVLAVGRRRWSRDANRSDRGSDHRTE